MPLCYPCVAGVAGGCQGAKRRACLTINKLAGIVRSPETAVISDNGAINLRTHHERSSRQGDGAIAAETDRKREASGLCGAPQGGGTVAGDYLGDAGRETGRSGAAGAAEGQQVTITTHYRESLLTGCRGCDTVAAASVQAAKIEAPHRANGLRLLCRHHNEQWRRIKADSRPTAHRCV